MDYRLVVLHLFFLNTPLHLVPLHSLSSLSAHHDEAASWTYRQYLGASKIGFHAKQ